MTLEVYTLLVITIFTSALVFCFWLYHKAHGRDVDAVRSGGELVMEALQRDGRLMTSSITDDAPTVFNYNNDDTEDAELSPVDAALARTQARMQVFADQEADKKVNEVMENMNKTQVNQ